MQNPLKTTYVCTMMLTHGCNLNCVYCFEKFKDARKNMTFETAQYIINKEVQKFHDAHREGQLKFDFFGGEPLLRFSLIQQVCMWAWEQNFPVPITFSITTNGTLLDENKKDWLRQHKDKIRLIMSVDGMDDTQGANRGCHINMDAMTFLFETWPDTHVKATASKESIHSFGEGIVYWLKQGKQVEASFGVGVDWNKEDAAAYKRALEIVGDYCLEHMDIKPMGILMYPYTRLLEPLCNQIPPLNCGIERSMILYDYDGKEYPCHLFLPIVHGDKDVKGYLNTISWKTPERFWEGDCKKCELRQICRTCYGFNYTQRGDVANRDKRLCNMLLAEAQIGSQFQINYYMKLSTNRELTTEELLYLQAALVCYEKFKNFSF